MLLWQGSIVEIDYGFFRVFVPYFIGKSLDGFKILIFGLWVFISHPYAVGLLLLNINSNCMVANKFGEVTSCT